MRPPAAPGAAPLRFPQSRDRSGTALPAALRPAHFNPCEGYAQSDTVKYFFPFFYFFFLFSQLNFQKNKNKKTKSPSPTGAPGGELGALPAPAAGLLPARRSRPAQPGGSRYRGARGGTPEGPARPPPGSREAASCLPPQHRKRDRKEEARINSGSCCFFFFSFFFNLNSQRQSNLSFFFSF